jgi:hypothetical protein
MQPWNGPARAVPRATKFPFASHRSLEEVQPTHCWSCQAPLTAYERGRYVLCLDCRPKKPA